MKYSKVFKLLSVMFVILIVAAAIGCGKKAAEEATPTPTAISTPTATPAEPAGQTGSLSDVTGDVQVLRSWGSSWIAAASGMKIGTGDSLKTGSNGYVLITFFDGSVMEVESDSEISVEELSKASGGSTTVRISQVLGNTLNRVENLVDSSSTYEVETPAGSAVVRGTWYSVIVELLGDIVRTCCGTLDQGDGQGHSIDFSNAGVTKQVGVNLMSCATEGYPPSDPFYPDPNNDPLKGSTLGGGPSCQRPCQDCSDCMQYGYNCYCNYGCCVCPQPTPTTTQAPCLGLGYQCQIGAECCSGCCNGGYCASSQSCQ